MVCVVHVIRETVCVEIYGLCGTLKSAVKLMAYLVKVEDYAF